MAEESLKNMNVTINYLMSGRAHLPYLMVSLANLRRHYSGPVVVHAYPESIAQVRRIAADSSLYIEAREWEPVYQGKNGQFLNKICLMQTLQKDTIQMYLDADTMVADSLEYLFLQAEDSEFVATQFCDWVSNCGVIKNRVSKLLGKEGIRQESIQYVLNNPLPSVNGGVFLCRSTSDVLVMWERWTRAAINEFIADEVCLHGLIGVFGDMDQLFSIACGGHWNCSPKYKPFGMKNEDVSIWHFHGDSNVRPSKSKLGYDIWWPEYQRCISANTGNCSEWLEDAVSQNRFLKELQTCKS